MPPVVFVDKVAGTVNAGVVSFAPPVLTKPGDTLLAVVLLDPANADFDPTSAVSAAWENLATHQGANAAVFVARRIAAADDGAEVELELTGPGLWVLAVLLVYRGLDPAAPLVASSASDVNASTNFVCPSRALTTYSDLYLGIAGVSSAAVAVAPPAGTTERYDAGAGGRELEVFDFLAEATGATGTKTATTGANQSGIAASYALAALPVQTAQGVAFDPAGAVGLPVRGV